ncbi:hypothetical protein FOMPIDRAFT_61739 [Fomitopsis schrenkii]|uniref:Barwin domain-containing protein n=1 Tax=Fomitopsis schrenkii TaxID=2126942 RepID=S8DY65_FOMSC|nr:hypothetical protein FOMPIDRAFT_61739 [Fomitopsis schrenkii]
MRAGYVPSSRCPVFLLICLQATYYEVGGAAGAFGYHDSDSGHVVAISHSIYGSGSNCNQWIHIKNMKNDKAQYGKTRDRCSGCGQYDIVRLDLSPSLFQGLGEPLGKGVFGIEWHFMAKGWSPEFP